MMMRSRIVFKPYLHVISIFFLLSFLPIEIRGQITSVNPVYLLTYDHGGLVLWGTDHFARYLRSAISWLDRYPDFKIGLDNEAYTYDFLKKHDTVLLEELRGYLRKYSGRFGIGTCTYGQPLSQFINEESNIRQIGYALETDQSVFQYRPSVYLMSEHAMHSQIPQILKGFGFKGAIMRTHFMMYGFNPTYNSPIGWWIGRDGSRIPAIPTYRGEGSGFGWVTEDNLILTRYPGPECDEPLEDFRKKFSEINPLLATRADDSGLRQEGLVKKYDGNPAFKWILLDEIFPNFPVPADEFNPSPDDFHVRMPWGYCGNEIWNMSRQAEVKVLTAERLAAIEFLTGGDNPEKYLNESWKNLLVAQHHDIQICGILDDSRRFLPASISISDSIINASMNFISSGMEGGKSAQITVFNPLSWNRKEWIMAKVALPAGMDKFIVKRGKTPVPYEIVSTEKLISGRIKNVRLSILVEIPALTFQSFSIVPVKAVTNPVKTIIFDREKLEIETPFWIIKLDKNGGISGIRNRMTGKEMIQDRRSGYFAGVIDGQPVESHGAWHPDSVIMNNNQITLHEDGSIGSIPYRLEMRLNDASPRIDFTTRFHFNDQQIGRVSENKREVASSFLHEEKLRFKVFPRLGIGTTGIRDLPFTIAETEEKYIEGNYWTALADGHSGLAYFNRGNMGSVHEEDGSFSIPLAYSMYYIWKTVILKGDFTYEFALYPFEGRWNDAGLHQKALDFNFPMVINSSKGGNGTLGNQYQPVQIESNNILLSALYIHGGNILIRFYESKGSEGNLNLKFLRGPLKLTEVDLSGSEQGAVNSPYSFKPWQIRTFMPGFTGNK